MTIGEHREQLGQYTIKDFDPATGLAEVPAVAYRVRADWDEWEGDNDIVVSKLQQILDDPRAAEMEALVIGVWAPECPEPPTKLVTLLTEQAAKLPALKALMFGDITYEEQEISWIEQTDLGPMLMAYPELNAVTIRGGTGLRLSGLDHPKLTTLTIETGGLPKAAIADVCSAKLPALTNLVLWLGTQEYLYW